MPGPDSCHLLGTTGLIVQASMGLLVAASLLLKRQLERRKRPWRIWSLDVGKQLVGQAVVHGWNVLVSTLVAGTEDNPCSLYFLNILLDCTFGVGIFFLVFKASTWLLSVKLGQEGYVSGNYGTPPQLKYWGRQLVPYLAAIIVMKLLVLLPLTLPGISTALVWFGQAILSVLSPAAQVIFVMAIFPLVMNVLQFCIVDQLIKSVDAEYERIDTEVDTLEQDYGSTSPGGLVIDRSGAPSPDTIRPLSLRPRTPSRSPSPSRSPQIHFQSRLSDDQGREARNLSPICSRPAVNVHDVLGMNQR